MTSLKPETPFCNFGMLPTHTSCIAAQPHKTWIADSASLVQTWHLSSLIILLFTRLHFVGKMSLHALHPKILILFGTQSFHKTGQMNSPLKILPDSHYSRNLLATLYADLTENFPCLLCNQMIESEKALLLRGILVIASKYSLWNNVMIISPL